MLAAADDIPALVRVINAAYEVEKSFVSGDRTDVETVRRLMTKGVFVVTRDEGGLTACVFVELRVPRAYFGMLSVEPSRQGQGLGRRLVDEVERYARRHGCEAMDIRVVNLRTELQPFYRKLGYVEHGIALESAAVSRNTRARSTSCSDVGMPNDTRTAPTTASGPRQPWALAAVSAANGALYLKTIAPPTVQKLPTTFWIRV